MNEPNKIEKNNSQEKKTKLRKKEEKKSRLERQRREINVTKPDTKLTRHLMHFYILRGRYVGVTSSRHSLLTREEMLHVRFCVGDRAHAAGAHCCVVVVVRCQIQIGWWRWKKSRDSYGLTGVKRGRRVQSRQSCNTLENTRRWQSGFSILIPTLFNGMTQYVHATALPPHFLQHGAALEMNHALLHVLKRRMLSHLIWILMFRNGGDKNEENI